MSYLLAFAGFAALIILHEAGHFAVAKAVGMRVEKFSLFFGPMLWSFRRGETEYGIAAIPLGGYVKITGMNPREEIPEEAVPRAYYNQKVWKRIVVILAGPFVNLVIAFLIIWVLLLSNGQTVASKPIGPVHAAGLTVSDLWNVTTRTVGVVVRIFQPEERKQLGSVVGGYTVTQQSFAHDTTRALEVLALISLSLAIINLFPFLPL